MTTPESEPPFSGADDGPESQPGGSSGGSARAPDASWKQILVGVGAVAAAVVIVFALFLSGVAPRLGNGSAGGAGNRPVDSATAATLAQALARERGAGELYGMLGISPTTSFAARLSELSGACPLGGTHRSAPTIGPSSGNYSSGSADGWVFLYFSTGNVTLSLLGVVGSQSYFLGSYQGSSCVGNFSGLEPLPTSFSSSEAAASTADLQGPGVGAFVAHHTLASAEYVLMAEANSTLAPVWKVLYTTCSVGPSSGAGNGASAVAYVDAGDPLAGPLWANSSSSSACGSGGNPLPGLGGIDLEAFQWTRAGSDPPGYYSDLRTTVVSPAPTNQFGLMVVNATSGRLLATEAVPSSCQPGAEATLSSCPAPSGPNEWYAALTNKTGTILASYGGSNATWGYSRGVHGLIPAAGDYYFVVASVTLHDGYLLSPYGTISGSGTLLVTGAHEL